MATSSDNRSTTKDSLIGRQLGDYRLTSKLAAGGMARIYKGMDYKLQRQAAVKVLEKQKSDDDSSLTMRFRREARAVAALEHDNIITIYQYGEDDDVYFLAMKLVKGNDLATEISRLRKSKKKMDVERALYIMGQVASALDYAHTAGIIHRDVKPSNILLDKNDKAVLTDFGLVLRTSSETTLGTAFGTPRYIAPEQAISSSKAAPQSDIYALAVILYEILTGATPFNGDTPMQIALSQISDPPPMLRSLNPEIPEAAEKEILKALEKDPLKRHETASEFVRAVRQAYAVAAVDAENDPHATLMLTQNVNGSQTIGINSTTQGVATPVLPTRNRFNSPLTLIALVVVALVIAGAFIVNGLDGVGGAMTSNGGAPVALLYDDSTFTMVNEGDYTLEVQKLMFIRGAVGGSDDFSGDRVPRDALPEGQCFQIALQGQQPSVPPQCAPIGTHRQGLELLLEPRDLHWRTETKDGNQIASFEVRYDNQLVARCDTVAEGEIGECRFNWPITPTPVPEDS